MSLKRLWFIGLWVAMVARIAAAQEPFPKHRLPEPIPATDGVLTKWEPILGYYRALDAASERVLVRELGRTTGDAPYIAVWITDRAEPDDLEPHRAWQERLADPRKLGNLADDVLARQIERGKIAVLITCTIHSSETASTYMAMRLAHELASGTDPETREILRHVVLILVPSANPDGIDLVADWYARSKGQPWEGTGMPWLYHPYAGHDTNRDFFMLNLQETRLLTRLLYREWFPTVAYDVHEMGRDGARMFVPPFHDPVNPNVDPRIHQRMGMIGLHMASALASGGHRGVLTNAIYDNWWLGGNRTTPQRHNIVAVLTESASVKLATPIWIEPSALRGSGRGFPDHKPATNFVDPWPGGWWRLRDIAEYQRVAARALLLLCARYQSDFQKNYLALARDAIRDGRAKPPYGWVIPADQRDPGSARAMLRILHETGVEMHQARAPFLVGGVEHPAGSMVLLSSQPYRAHLKDLMERQAYPARVRADGEIEPPYDVAGWTLPLQMGVQAVTIEEPVDAIARDHGAFTLLEREPEWGHAAADHPAGDGLVQVPFTTNASLAMLRALLAAGVPVELLANEPASNQGRSVQARMGKRAADRDQVPRLRFALDARSRPILESEHPWGSVRCTPLDHAASGEVATWQIRAHRIGVYQPWMPSMDEGWTRFVLDQAGFRYETLHNAEIRSGNLKDRVDVLIVPSIGVRTLREGYLANQTAPEYTGGMGAEGVEAVREFLLRGGSLVCLEESSRWAIEELRLPVRELVAERPRKEFYGPGSLLRAEFPTPAIGSCVLGMPATGAVYFDRSLAFDVIERKPGDGFAQTGVPRVAATYQGPDPLLSGYLAGGELLADRAAIVEVPFGSGNVTLFAFPPQHRGQTHGTFRLLLNTCFAYERTHPSGEAPPARAGVGGGR
jgi:hypothetical protein